MLASLKVASNTSSTNSRKDIRMDYNQLKEKLSMLDPVLKEMNIKTLTISEDEIQLTLSEIKQKPKVRDRYFRSDDTRFSQSRKRIKDPRWIKIADTLHLTPKEWLDREYPGLDYDKIMGYMYRNKTKSIRECCEYCRE